MKTLRAVPTLVVGALVVLAASSERAKAQADVKLKVITQGPNAGSVGARNIGLCMTTNVGEGVTCEYLVPAGTTVMMSANVPYPSTPGVFTTDDLTKGSAPDDCRLKTTCRFTIDQDSTITVTFDFEAYNALFRTITVNLAGAGDREVGFDNNRCQDFDPRQSSSCTTVYAEGSLVTLEARRLAASLFAGFSNGTDSGGSPKASDCSTTPCTFPLFTSASLTATFAALDSLSIDPPSASIDVGQMQVFQANGRFINPPDTDRIVEVRGDMGTWKFKTDMPTARFGLAAGVLDGRLYAIGGVTSALNPAGDVETTPVATVEAYDPSANAWSSEPSLSIVRSSLAAAVTGGKLYAIGGSSADDVTVASVEAFDGSSWSSVAPMSIERRSLAAGALNGKLYAVGGKDSAGNVLDLVEEYDPASNQWTTKAPMPTPRWSLGVGVVDGILYAVGGQDASGNIVATVEAYDPATDAWTTKRPMPSQDGGQGPRELHAVAVTEGRLYAIGGNYGGRLSSAVAYEPAGDVWFFKDFMPSEAFFDRAGTPMERSELAAGSIDGVLYAVGGQQVQMLGSLPAPRAVAIPILQAFTDALVWGTNDASVASLSQLGQATGLRAGTTTVTARTGSISATATLEVTTPANVVPMVTIFSGGFPSPLGEGQRITPGGSFRDPDAGQTWAATVDYGDGGGPQPLTLTPGSGGGPTGTFSLDHRYADNGTYTIAVAVSDSAGATGTATRTVTVDNVAPMLAAPGQAFTEVGGTQPWACVSFFDPGTADAPWSATVDYGDGSGVQTIPGADIHVPGSCGGPSGPNGPTGNFQLSRAYDHSGTFTVTVTVTDKDGGSDMRTFPVEVSEPEPELLALSLTPMHASIQPGELQQFLATATFSDGSTYTTSPGEDVGLTWISTNAAVASVDNTGLARGLAPGQAQIVIEIEGVSCLSTNTCATLNVEPDLAGRMHGDGHIDAGDLRHHFEFRVMRDPGSGQQDGRLQYRVQARRSEREPDDDDARHGAVSRFVASSVSLVRFSDDPTLTAGRRPQSTVDTVFFSGTGLWNGTPGYSFEVRATDAGEPGGGRDELAITIFDPSGTVAATVSAALSGGNIQSQRVRR